MRKFHWRIPRSLGQWDKGYCSCSVATLKLADLNRQSKFLSEGGSQSVSQSVSQITRSRAPPLWNRVGAKNFITFSYMIYMRVNYSGKYHVLFCNWYFWNIQMVVIQTYECYFASTFLSQLLVNSNFLKKLGNSSF